MTADSDGKRAPRRLREIDSCPCADPSKAPSMLWAREPDTRPNTRSTRGVSDRPWLAAEDASALFADVHDLALLQLQPVGLLTRQLRPGLLAVLQRELDADLESQVHDPVDHRLLGGAV